MITRMLNKGRQKVAWLVMLFRMALDRFYHSCSTHMNEPGKIMIIIRWRRRNYYLHDDAEDDKNTQYGENKTHQDKEHLHLLHEHNGNIRVKQIFFRIV
jgi:hypothetical protein